MKFLLYSGFGEGSQILKRIQLEGNEVGLYIDDKIYKNVFDGLLPKVDNPESFIDKETTIIFDMSGFGSIADTWRRKGNYIYGASKFADNLEHDRNFGFESMQKSGIKIPEYKEFTKFPDAVNYIKDNLDKRLVFKPNGSMPCKLTYVSDDSEQLLEYLRFVEERFSKDIDSFILQDFVEGCVVSSEFFCSYGELLWPPNHTVEVKKSMNDDLGPSTGCSGNITWNCSSNIIGEGIWQAADMIKKELYTGQIDLNAVVNETGVYGLEWTPRFGYDATPTYLTLLDMELGKFFSDCSRGQIKNLISTNNNYAGAVRLSIPPYPMEVKGHIDTEKISPNMGIPIQNWEDNQRSIYFYEVMRQNDVLVHSGGTGVICLGIGHGDESKNVLDEPYKILEDIKIPDKQYRTDLREVLDKMVKDVEEYA